MPSRDSSHGMSWKRLVSIKLKDGMKPIDKHKKKYKRSGTSHPPIAIETLCPPYKNTPTRAKSDVSL